MANKIPLGNTAPSGYVKPRKKTCSFVPTHQMRKKVTQMKAFGFPERLICEQIINPRSGKPIDWMTFQKHFANELDECEAAMNAEVAQTMYRYATSKNQQAVAAGKFWLTHKAKWRPAVAESEDGGKFTLEIVNKLDI